MPRVYTSVLIIIIIYKAIINIAVQMSVSIEVVSERERTFRVTCTATGGTLSTSSLTGPGLGGGGLQLQAEGSIGRTGQNTYSVTSDILSGQSSGATYTCAAMNNVSAPESTALAGIIVTCITICKTTWYKHYDKHLIT